MKLIKLILFICLLGVIGLAATSVAANRGVLQTSKINSLISQLPIPETVLKELQSKFPSASSLPSFESGKDQASILTSRFSTVQEQTTKVLGTSIQVNEQANTPLYEKAFEAARYQYCQQVIIDYERRLKESNTTQPTE
jgi:hypothetical protein